ncbi:MAG: carbon-nitrogen hydrolase family protein [Armatimonadota bacterium]|nr:carbon-nitrogen hydrolase family protein [Armatimonadota bacterium]
MRVGLAQYGSSADKAANLIQAAEVAREAGRRGVDLLVFHEVYMYRRPPEATVPPAEVAEPLDGPFMQGVRRAAAEHRLHLVMGLLERAPGESYRAYNTAVLVAPSGQVLAVYRKVHLYDAFDGRESESFVPGDAPPPVADTPLGRIGLQICYDIRFPEWSRLLALQGAEYLVVPTRWVPGPLKEEHWLTLVRARAIENTCWVIAAADVPPYRLGRSVVVDPMGVVVADGGEEAGLVTVDVDPDRVRRVRAKNPSLLFRRPDLYGALAEKGVAAANRRE